MSNPVVINTLEELNSFLNEKGVLEIALRSQKKRFKAFQKVLIDTLPDTQQKELTSRVIQALNRKTTLNERSMKLLSNMAQVEKFGLLLNGVNLCTTVAGFAIMYKKLDTMSTEISQKLKQIDITLKQSQDIQNQYEIENVLSAYENMLDCQRKQKPYDEDQMISLVTSEYGLLKRLIDCLKKDYSGDYGTLISAIISLLAMFTVSLCKLDEIYYFNNRQSLRKESPWHFSHNKWMGIFDTLSSVWFIEKLQDYGTFETNLSTLGVDIYYTNLIEQVTDWREIIQENQAMIVAMGEPELLERKKELYDEEYAAYIWSSFEEEGQGLDKEAVQTAYQSALQLAGIN